MSKFGTEYIKKYGVMKDWKHKYTVQFKCKL